MNPAARPWTLSAEAPFVLRRDGEPTLLVGGQVFNSASSSPKAIADSFAHVRHVGSNVVLSPVSFHYRLHGFTRRLLEVLRSGMLGDIRHVDFDFSIPHFVVKPGNIRLDADLGGGSFMDVGCYAVDLVRAAWGEPTVVSAEAVLNETDPRVDMQTDAALELPGGIPVSIRSSFIGDDRGSMSLRVEGSAASLVATSVIVPQWGAVLTVTAGDEVLLEERATEGENSYARQLEHVVAALRAGEPSELDAALGVGTMRVVDEVYRAAGLQPR